MPSVEKARLFLKPHENHIAVLKVKRNEPLTPTDLSELERIFLEAGVDQAALETLQAEGGLPRFVRTLDAVMGPAPSER